MRSPHRQAEYSICKTESRSWAPFNLPKFIFVFLYPLAHMQIHPHLYITCSNLTRGGNYICTDTHINVNLRIANIYKEKYKCVGEVEHS